MTLDFQVGIKNGLKIKNQLPKIKTLYIELNNKLKKLKLARLKLTPSEYEKSKNILIEDISHVKRTIYSIDAINNTFWHFISCIDPVNLKNLIFQILTSGSNNLNFIIFFKIII